MVEVNNIVWVLPLLIPGEIWREFFFEKNHRIKNAILDSSFKPENSIRLFDDDDFCFSLKKFNV